MNRTILFIAAALLLLASVLAGFATGLHLGSSAVLTAFEPLPITPVATNDKKSGKGTTRPTGKQSPQKKSNTPKQPNRPKQRSREDEYYV
jgi:hypothetical protein